MNTETNETNAEKRTREIFDAHWLTNARRTDRMFAVLMAAQWVFAIVVAVVISPFAWEGSARAVHVHVYAAVFLGGAISALPIALSVLRPGALVTRITIGVAQMLWSALLIHLTGGRIETHFHVFGSLAFVAFYRDWRVLIPATVVVAGDHLLRQLFWPESVYGIANPVWWRFLEHAGWVVFEDIVLLFACVRGVEEMKRLARQQADVEVLSESERQKAVKLDAAINELRSSREAQMRTERLAAVGQLAASVGHELRNPLAAVRNANTYVQKKLAAGKGKPVDDPRVDEFLAISDRELVVCTTIISDLLDFARERKPQLQPCPLRQLVDEAIAVVAARTPTARVTNTVPEDLPMPSLDRDMFRQVLINLVQNAVEASPADSGKVTVEASMEDGMRVRVVDNGSGVAPDVAARIFEPLFTTKSKGTGLGLAIVANIVKAHGGTVRLESGVGAGATAIIEIAPQTARAA